MPTPIRDKKVGLPDPQANGGQPTVATTEPSAMVQQMAAQNFALKNGGQMPPVMQGAPNSSIPPVATVQPMNVFAGGNQIIGKYNVPTNPQQNNASVVPDPQNGTEGVQFTNPADTGQNNLDSLSAALNGTSLQPQQPQFQADPSQRDGGFFNWVKGLIPKKRPGRREGETDDEYDARHTRNMQMVATLADAIRHMGNIVNTSKGAPLQQFNDPNTMLEQGRQARKAERQKQAALDADAAYKQANLTLKERAAEAERLYKQISLGYKDAADKRAAQAAADNKKYKDDYFAWQKENEQKRQERQAAQDKQRQDNWQKNFDENKRHHSATERISASKGKGKGSGRGGGSGGKYWFEDKDGKMHYQPNKTMWEQEFYREYGYLPNETSTSTSTKTYDKNGNETTTTTRKKGTAMTAEAAKRQNDAKTARSKPKATQKSKNGYKNTKALGL